MSSPFLSIWKFLFFFIFASFQWLRKTEIYALSWNEYDVLDRCLNMNLEINTKSRNKYYVPKLIQCLKNMPCHGIDTIWFWYIRMIKWLEIDRPTMTRNWYDVMALIQCFKFDIISCSFADLISKAESFCWRICLHVLTCSRTS